MSLPAELLLEIFYFCQDIFKITLVSPLLKELIISDRSLVARLIHWPKTADFETCISVIPNTHHTHLKMCATRFAVLLKNEKDGKRLLNVINNLQSERKQLFLIIFIRQMLILDHPLLKNTDFMISLLKPLRCSKISLVLKDNFLYYGKVHYVSELFTDIVFSSINELSHIVKEELLCNNLFQYKGTMSETDCLQLHPHPKKIPNFVVTKNYRWLSTFETQILILGALNRHDYPLLKKLIPDCFVCPGVLFNYFPPTIEFFDIIVTQSSHQLQHILKTIFQLSVKAYFVDHSLEQFYYFLQKVPSDRTLMGNSFGMLCLNSDIKEMRDLQTIFESKMNIHDFFVGDYFGNIQNLITDLSFYRLSRYLEKNQDDKAIDIVWDDETAEKFLMKCLRLKKYQTIITAINSGKYLTPERCLLFMFAHFDQNVDFEFVKILMETFQYSEKTLRLLSLTIESFKMFLDLYENKIMW